MSGSFKKLAKAGQRIHRERSQPEHRAKLGHLEKHKDYVERARDHHKKRDKIKALRLKALDRNPDEFYFNMVSSSKVDGVHQANEKTTPEQELFEQSSKDLRYVSFKKDLEMKKIDKLKETLNFLDPQFRQNKHVKFVDSEKDIPKAKKELQKLKMLDHQKMCLTEEQQQELEDSYRLLAKRQARLENLKVMEEKLQVSMHLSKNKGAKKKLVKEETKTSAAVYRWCYERKR